MRKLFVGGLLFTGLLVGGIFLLIRSCLSKYDERYALAPALYLEKQGQPVLFSIVKFEKTTSFSQHGGIIQRSVSTWYYVQSNDAKTGNLINYKKVRHHSDIPFFPVKTLGVAADAVWVLMGEIMAFDPLTLAVKADQAALENKNPALKGMFPAEERFYRLNPADQQLYITAKDGVQWKINCATLEATPADLYPPENRIDSVLQLTQREQHKIQQMLDSLTQPPYTFASQGRQARQHWYGRRDSLQQMLFALRNRESEYQQLQRGVHRLQRTGISFGQIKNNQDTCVGKWFGLYSKEEMQELPDRLSMHTAYGEAARRILYTAPYEADNRGRYNIRLNDAAPLSPESVFLQGGFLLNKQTGLPIRLHDPEGALVVHKDQVGNEGRILLSRIHFDGSLAWTLNTDLYEWIDWQLSGTHLYVSGNHLNKGGNDKVTMMWSIPLATGNATRFFYND